MPQTPNATHERTAATRLSQQSDSAHHSRTRHAWRKDGRTKEGRTGRKDGAGIILRELSHGMLTLLALDRAHALSHHNSLVLCRSLPFLYRGISFMHFGFLRVLNDGAFANYRPTEPMHGHRQSDIGYNDKPAGTCPNSSLTIDVLICASLDQFCPP